MRGIRIELEALEQAIVELPAVKHCEAGSRALRSEGLPKTMSSFRRLVFWTTASIWCCWLQGRSFRRRS